MNFYKMAINNLFKQMKQCRLFIVTIAVATIAIFNAMNITMNENIMSQVQDLAFIMSLISFALVFVAVLMSAYVCYFFCISKTKEIGVIGISGASVYYIGGYMSIQCVIIELIGSIIGVTIGVIISPLIGMLVNKNLGISGSVFCVSPLAIGLTFAWVLIEVAYAVIFALGYAYRKTIVELMKEAQISVPKVSKKWKSSSTIYIILYLLTIVLLFLIGGTNGVDVAPYICLFTFIAASRIIDTFIPNFIDNRVKKGKICESEKIIWTGNLNVLLKRTSILLGIMMIGIISINSVSMLYSDYGEASFLLNIQLIAFLVLISLAIIYKIMVEVLARKGEFKNLRVIGYTKNQILQIIKMEVVVYFLVFIALTFTPALAISIPALIKGTIPLLAILKITLPGLLTVIIVGIICYIQYVNIIFKEN